MDGAARRGTASTALDDPRRLGYIDALRGLAILGVMMSHAAIAVPAANTTLQTIMTAGARGVQLFYIASALTLAASWQFRSSREQHPIRNFYLRRLFRIAPMFYLAIVGYSLLYGFEPRYGAPNGIRWYYLPLTALFVNGFHPETITSVVPGGWSIAVEMTFYLVLPLLLRYFRTAPSLLLLFVGAWLFDRVVTRVLFLVYLPQYPPEQADLVHNLAYLNFFSQLPVFACGLLAFALSHNERYVRYAATIALPAFVVLCAALIVSGADPLARLVTRHVLIGVGFALLAMALMYRHVAAIVNPLTISIGRFSFSIYLLHFAVIAAYQAAGLADRLGRGNGAALLFYGGVVAASYALASITYRWIERPGIELGRRVILSLARRDGVQQSIAPAPAERAW